MKFEIRATHSGAIPFTATVYVIAISGQQVNFLNHPDAGVSADDAGPEAHRYPEQHVLARRRNLHFFHRGPVDDELWHLDARMFRGKDRVQRRRRHPHSNSSTHTGHPANFDRLTEIMPVTKMMRKVIDPKPRVIRMALCAPRAAAGSGRRTGGSDPLDSEDLAGTIVQVGFIEI
jgi:hypothetical protein